MKRNVLLIPFVAVLAVFLVAFVAAGELAPKNSVVTEFNNVVLDPSTVRAISGTVGDSVPVRVTFRALKDMSDVRVKIRMEGHRDDVSAETSRFDIINGVTYTKLLNLDLPTDEDDASDVYTFYVEIVSKNDRTEKVYNVMIQRDSYTLEIDSVDYPSKVSAGESVPVSVVVKNTGYSRADDVYVVVSIPSLGISAQKYVGDLVTTEDDNSNDHEDEDDTDSMSVTVYLNVPEDAKGGVHLMEVEVYNDDISIVTESLIGIGASESVQVLAAVKNKDLNAGETVTYDLIIVNSADNVKVFNLKTVFGTGLVVSAPSIVTVGAGSSETVPISVTASSDATVGTYTFSVNVDGQEVVFGANVVGTSVSASVVALTIILVIIFVVLLAVLIVLLARKEKPMEEVETSYY